jgi:hypothetical protein
MCSLIEKDNSLYGREGIFSSSEGGEAFGPENAGPMRGD